MSRFQQYILLGGLIAVLHWTSVGSFLRSTSLFNFAIGFVIVLWGICIIITFPALKKKWKQKKEERLKKGMDNDEAIF